MDDRLEIEDELIINFDKFESLEVSYKYRNSQVS